MSDATYARARAQFGEGGIIDLLGVVGYYATNAMIMDSFGSSEAVGLGASASAPGTFSTSRLP